MKSRESPRGGSASAPAGNKKKPAEAGRIPRILRLTAVAIRLERMLRTGEVSDLTELARLGHVTQSRMSKVLNLFLLVTDIHEALRFLPGVKSGKPPIHEKMLRPRSAEVDWRKQRELWGALRSIVFLAGAIATATSV